LPLQYLHTSFHSLISFLYKVLHLSVSVLTCLSFSQENRHPVGMICACRQAHPKISFSTRNTCIPLPTTI